MTTETDAEFVERISREVYPGFDGWRTVSMMDHSLDRLFAIARRGAEMQWRPIEEAPSDGTRLLLAKYASHSLAQASGPDAFWAIKGYWDGDDWTDGLDRLIPPTHWMPVPFPPKGGSNDDQP